MRVLVVDRSTSRPGFAVFEAGRLAYEHVWAGEPSRAPEWLDELSRLLAERGLDAAGAESFVCGLGPGSFSGIRACLAALSGLALPGGRPVLGVASAAALALGQAGGVERVTVVGDARRDRLWCVTYRVDEAAGRVALDGGAAPAQTAADFRLVPAGALAAAVPAGSRVVTSDWERLAPVLRATFPDGRLVERAVYPRPADLGRLALSGPGAAVPEPVPIYLHPAVAAQAGAAPA